METSKIARGALYITLQNVIAFIMPFLFYTVITRILTPEEAGKVSILTFTMTLFTTVTQLAVPIASTKFISENIGRGRADTATAAAKTSLNLILLTTVPSTIVALIASSWLSPIILGASDEAYLLMAIFVTSAIQNVTSLLGSYLLGLNLFAEVAAQNLIFAVISRTAAVALAWIGYRLAGIVTGYLLGSIVCLGASMILLRGRLRHGSGHFPARDIIAYSYPVLINSVIGIIQGWADVIILYSLTSDLAIVGIYYLTIAGTGIITVLWTPITTTMFPTMSAQYGKTGPEGLNGPIRASTRLINLMVIPASVCLAAASQTAIRVAYGPDYLVGAVPFAVLTIVAAVPAYGTLFGTALQAVGETKAIAKIGLISVTINIVTITLLTKPLNVVGTALGRVAMLLAGLTLSYKMLKESVSITVDMPSLKKSILVSATIATPMALVDWFYADSIPLSLPWRLAIEATLFTCVGIVAVKMWKLFEADDFKLIRQALPRQLHALLDLAEGILL